MKIEILVDKKSRFPEKLLETISGIKHIAHKISDISINYHHEIDCPIFGVYINSDILAESLTEHQNASNYDRTIYVTKAALSRELNAHSKVSAISFYEACELEQIQISDILDLFESYFLFLLTEAEKEYLIKSKHPIKKPDPLLRFKLPLKEVVMIIHGMNTYAYWEKDLTTFLNSRGIFTASGYYEHFLGVMIPSKRNDVRSIILSKYQQMIEDYPSDQFRHTVIAHSFGTYGFFDVLHNESISKFPDTIIFAAPILDRKNKLWNKLISKNIRIYLDIGKRDYVTKIAGLLRLTGASLVGLSGWFGVKEANNLSIESLTPEEYLYLIKTTGNNLPVNLIHKGKGHSDYFSNSHFENRWLPLIKQKT
ncbi:MAG: hypothetical protein JAY67_06945 [Candidatus Thiodiazotropha taylori]|nr:hypothetical protein [Candidatus Thiodiazotropha taylori]